MLESIISKTISPLIFLSAYVCSFGFMSNITAAANQLVFKKFILDAFATGFQSTVDVLYIITYKDFDKVGTLFYIYI